MPTRRSIAAVLPEPTKMTAVESSPPTAARTISRASSRSLDVARPVPLASVWVFAYRGSTSSRTKSSTKVSARPEAVQSAYVIRSGP